jgi:hypothetical protein
VADEPLVSVDFRCTDVSTSIDSSLTMVMGDDMVKVRESMCVCGGGGVLDTTAAAVCAPLSRWRTLRLCVAGMGMAPRQPYQSRGALCLCPTGGASAGDC